NPKWIHELTYADASFVMAHELLHLCLQTHERSIGTDKRIFNWAHDYIINDILSFQLAQAVPAQGLVMPGARLLSAEKIVTLMKQGKVPGPKRVARPTMTIALEEAGLLPPIAQKYGPGTNDLLDRETERDWFPDADPLEEELREQRIRQLAAKALSLGLLKERLDAVPPVKTKPVEHTDTTMMEALRQCYAPLW